MSAKGLHAIKETALLDDLTVTPELQAKLNHRIAQAKSNHHISQDGQQGPVQEMKPRRPWLLPAGYTAAAAAVLTLALLSAPQSNPSRNSSPTEQPVPLPPPYQQSGTTFTVTVNAKDMAGNSVNAQKVTLPGGEGDRAGGQAQSPQSGVEAQPGRKIITNGEYGIRVSDARAAVGRLEQEAIAAGGYVAEATVNKETNGTWVGRVVLRVPAARVAGTIGILNQIGTVERERQWTQDVTDQYMDLEHRLETLKEYEARLRQLADKAATFDDWNKLSGQINATRIEIENLTGRLKLVTNQVDFAILNIQLMQPAPGEVLVSNGATTTLGQMGQAFTNSLRAMGALLRRTTVGLAALGPYVLVLLVVVGGLVIGHRRRRRAG